MARFFPLQLVTTPQVLPLQGGEIGTHDIYLNFATAPSAGTVTIEQQLLGSTAWTVVQRANAVSITSGVLQVVSDGAAAALRVTFTGLTGGASPVLWVASNPTAWLPSKLMTDGGFGPNARMRVDIGQTGFFAGREFRTFREFSIASGATLVLRVTVPLNVILQEQAVEIDAGSLRITNVSGGTPGGTFSEVLPIIGKNNMSDRPTPFYTPTVVFEAGGTHTGGFVFDIHRVVAASATAQQSTVGNVVGDERGVAANTYYVRYENIGNGTATGTLWYIWEERP